LGAHSKLFARPTVRIISLGVAQQSGRRQISEFYRPFYELLSTFHDSVISAMECFEEHFD
jgi:hypothetical protein